MTLGGGSQAPSKPLGRGGRELGVFTALPQGSDDPADLDKARETMRGQPRRTARGAHSAEIPPDAIHNAPRTESARERATSSAAFLLLGSLRRGQPPHAVERLRST